jgi:uncharacterized membrane protein
MGIVPIFGGSSHIFFVYPLVPWIGVMAAGYAFGTIYRWDPERRRKFLLRLGFAATVLFVLIRLTNLYGDPFLWSTQRDPGFTILSFLNTTKYPPSLLFLLMTLGPALILLALADRIDGKTIWQHICIVFGRVPMFYYIIQWLIAHGLAVLLGYLSGKDVGYLFLGLLQMSQGAPPDHGFPLWVVYAAWIVGLILLYPLCAWYGAYKRRHKHWLLSYL